MPFQDLSRELSQLVQLFWTVLRKEMCTETSDNNGTTKEMREEDLKRLNKLNKRNDGLFK